MAKKSSSALRTGVIAACILLLIGFGLWFWSLGAFASEDVPPIRVEVTHGTAEWKAKDASDWKKVEMSTQVKPGDSVRTDADSAADIRWGDRGITRLDASTEVTVESAPEDPNATQSVLIQVKLSGGRVWSRVLKLLDVNSGFEVKTDAVVATVRGTAFGLAKVPAGAEAAVSESVVGIVPVSGGASTLLRDNQWGAFNATGTPTIVRELTDADAWPQQNKKEDAAFDAEIRNTLLQRFTKRLKTAPEWLTDASENLHLALANGDAKDDLRSAYLGRRIAVAVTDPSRADDLLGKNVVPIGLHGLALDRALASIRFGLFIQAARPGFMPNSVITNALRDVRARLLNLGTVPEAYAHALTIDDKIDSLLYPPSPIAPEDAKAIAGNLLGEIQQWQDGVGPELTPKADAMLDRLAGFGAAPTQEVVPTSTPSVVPPPVNTPPSFTVPKGTKTPTSQTPPPTQPAPTTQTSCGYRSLSLFASPNAVSVGDHVTLTLYGVCPNGQTDDITSRSSFNPAYTTDGSVSGNIYTPAKAGTLLVFGTFVDNGVAKSAQATVTVKPGVKKLTGVTVVALGPTTLSTSQRSPLDATAWYSDGSSMDIKYQCAWSVSDPKLGMVSSATFQSLSGTGNVSAICGYSENGIAQLGSVTFTITLDPSLTPTNGGTGCVPDYRIGKYCP